MTRAQDTIVGAAEGGINYWAEEVKILAPRPLTREMRVDDYIESITGIRFAVEEDGGLRYYNVSVAAVEAALNRIVRDHSLTGSHIRSYIVNDDIDADVADCAVQVAAFGKLVYG